MSFENKFLYISVIDEASDFKFGIQLGFAKFYHQITLDEKVDVALGRKLPKIWELPFNISATAEASNFKFCTHLGVARAHHKTSPRGNVGVSFG